MVSSQWSVVSPEGISPEDISPFIEALLRVFFLWQTFQDCQSLRRFHADS